MVSPTSEDLMAKSEPKPSSRSKPAKTTKRQSKRHTGPVSAVRSGKTKPDRILGMLHTRNGATIAAMARATGWQAHSVRGFLAGVVKKKLKQNLTSEKDQLGPGLSDRRVEAPGLVRQSDAGSRAPPCLSQG